MRQTTRFPRSSRLTDEQRQELQALGLFPEQVHRLELIRPSIAWRVHRGQTMTEVRDKLADLVSALAKVERLYIRISTAGTGPCAEASSRLYLAEEALGTGPDKLIESLDTAANIVNRALTDLPRTEGRHSYRGAQLVELIMRALQSGHGEHYVNQGKPMPAFEILAARKREPFPSIVRILFESAGGPNPDEAIKKYLSSRGKGGN
jgi:hypothetical protein